MGTLTVVAGAIKTAFRQILCTPTAWLIAGVFTAYFSGVAGTQLGNNVGKGWKLLGIMLVLSGLVYLSYVILGVYAELYSKPLKIEHANLVALKRNIEHAAHAADVEWTIAYSDLEQSNAVLQLQLDEALRINADLRNPPGNAGASLTTPHSPF